eukprot:s2168_g15.t1
MRGEGVRRGVRGGCKEDEGEDRIEQTQPLQMRRSSRGHLLCLQEVFSLAQALSTLLRPQHSQARSCGGCWPCPCRRCKGRLLERRRILFDSADSRQLSKAVEERP